MSYATNTILTRDEPKGDRFDRLRVIGTSPIRSSAVGGEWGGSQQSDLYIVDPIGLDEEFASPEIVPLSALQTQFSVESEPDPLPTHLESQQRSVAVRRLAPEEQIRRSLKEEEKQRPKRSRTHIGDESEKHG